jgi:hypothetical protein
MYEINNRFARQETLPNVVARRLQGSATAAGRVIVENVAE